MQHKCPATLLHIHIKNMCVSDWSSVYNFACRVHVCKSAAVICVREVCVHHSNNLTIFYNTKLFSVEPELPLSAQASSEVTALSPASTTARYREILNLILTAAKRLLDVQPSFFKAVSNQDLSLRLLDLTGRRSLSLKPQRKERRFGRWNFRLKGNI